MGEMEELENAVSAAQKAHRAAEAKRESIDQERESKRAKLISAFAATLRDDLDAEYGERRTAAWDAERTAKDAVHAAKVTRGLAKLALMGDPLRVRWMSVGARYGTPRTFEPTKDTGTLEVRTPSTPLPANVTWSAPAIGDVFLRKNKANGKPGSQIVRSSDLIQWHPLDWKPKQTP